MATKLLDAISAGLQQRAADQNYRANELALRTAQRQEELRPVENRLAQIALGQRQGVAPGAPGMKPEPQDQQSALMELVALNPEMGMQVQQAGFKLAADAQTRAENQAKALSGFMQSLASLPVEQRAAARDAFLQNPVAQAMVDNRLMAELAQNDDFSDAVIAPMVAGAGGQIERPKPPDLESGETADGQRAFLRWDEATQSLVPVAGGRPAPPREHAPPSVSYQIQPWMGPGGEITPVRINSRTGAVDVAEVPEGLRPAPKGQGADIDRLRKGFLKDTSDYALMVNAMGRIQAAARESSGAQDLALIFSYMKMLDPTSVVRESEFDNAVRTGGVPDQIAAAYNQITSGQRLTPGQRANFVRSAQAQLASARRNAQQIESEYRRIALGQGVDPDLVIVSREAPQQTAPAPGRLPPGVKSITPVQR